MLLAAGRGERMRPLTLTCPKPLLEVRGRALIDYHIAALAAAGVRDLVINVSWLAEQIVAHCGDGARYGVRIRYSREAEPLETAGGIVQALPLLGDAPFLLVNADIHTDYPLGELVARARDIGPQQARLVLVSNPTHNARGDFSLRGDRVVHAAGQTLTYAGLGVFDPGFFAGCVPGSRPLRPLLERAIAGERLFGEHYRGAWTDVGTPQRLHRLNVPDSEE
jgi:MurNAc alpha-1-phosphate uridylyltransferase